MFYKIDNKFYIKMRNYYKEVEVQGNNIVPSSKENSKIHDMSIVAIPVSCEEVLKAQIKLTQQLLKEEPVEEKPIRRNFRDSRRK